jgi:hypothetical protein
MCCVCVVVCLCLCCVVLCCVVLCCVVLQLWCVVFVLALWRVVLQSLRTQSARQALDAHLFDMLSEGRDFFLSFVHSLFYQVCCTDLHTRGRGRKERNGVDLSMETLEGFIWGLHFTIFWYCFLAALYLFFNRSGKQRVSRTN